MDLQEFRSKLVTAINQYESSRIKIALQATTDAIAEAADRVINRGESSRGDVFGEYADSTKKAKIRNNQTEKPYPNINFSDTNRMWGTTQGRVISSNATEIVIESAPSDPDRREIMAIHNERFESSSGLLTELNKEEQAMIVSFYEEYLDNEYNNIFE